jgi:hypothetical protein
VNTNLELPQLVKVRQRLKRPVMDTLVPNVLEQLQRLDNLPARGAKVALAVGSRGITDLVPIVRTVADFLVSWDLQPFVVACMGSHGGGTVDGQLEVLRGYGITEEALGIPVMASTETVSFFGAAYGDAVHVNKLAWDADCMVVINRVKKHTDIHAPIESGLCKMIAIGLGNKKQAEILHHNGLEVLSDSIPLIATDVVATGKVLFGVAIVENAYAETALVEVVAPEDMVSREKELLRYALELSPKLPVDRLDVLVIDEGGKDYSGSCIDTHVIGRMRLEGERDLHTPIIHRVVVCDLSEHSQGNAAGIGLADFITRRFFDKIDFPSTYTNCISCIFPERGKLPLVMESDEDAIAAALATCRASSRANPRVIRIHDTLHLEEMYVSKAVLNEIQDDPNIIIS